MGEELFVHKLFPALCNKRFDPLPYHEKLATGFEEQIFVEQAVVKQRTCLFPITRYHAKENPGLRSRRADFHSIIKVFREVVLGKPITGLAQPCLATLFEDL